MEKKTKPDQWGGVDLTFSSSVKNVEKNQTFIKIWYFFESNIALNKKINSKLPHNVFKGKTYLKSIQEKLEIFSHCFQSNFYRFLQFSVILGFGNRSTMCFGIFCDLYFPEIWQPLNNVFWYFSIFFSNFPWFLEKFKGKTYWWIHCQQQNTNFMKKVKKG